MGFYIGKSFKRTLGWITLCWHVSNTAQNHFRFWVFLWCFVISSAKSKHCSEQQSSSLWGLLLLCWMSICMSDKCLYGTWGWFRSYYASSKARNDTSWRQATLNIFSISHSRVFVHRPPTNRPLHLKYHSLILSALSNISLSMYCVYES